MVNLSVVIVSFNTRDLLARCLESLVEACRDINVQIIVVDNQSTDGTLGMLSSQFPTVHVLANTSNLGFAIANNLGMAHAKAETVLLLNSDAFICENAIRQGLEVLQRNPQVGIAGLRLDNEDGTFQAGDGSFPTLWDDVRHSIGLDQFWRSSRQPLSAAGPVDWVQGACMFVRRSAVSDVGGLDSHFFMYSEEVDWCWRFWRHGWEVWQLPDVSVIHLGGGSSKSNDIGRRIALYRSRLSLRRRLGGPVATAALWSAMVAGLAGRIAARSAARLILKRNVGRQSPATDFALLRAILHMDPLARRAVL
jgi:N-acetylglucosaminyl-diphospho-decaprenol L-rhamnosyltransferase